MSLQMIGTAWMVILVHPVLSMWHTSAFVMPTTTVGRGVFATTCTNIPKKAGTNPKSTQVNNAVDEILDALDTMLGVSPLSEEDLKSDNANNNIDWQQRVTERQQVAPPDDALDKPSVAVFFFFLGLFPVVSLFAAVQWGGIRPFNL